MRDEHNSQPDVVPLTHEELSVKVLKPRASYVKGIGLRPSSSLRATTTNTPSTDYVKQLETEIDKQKDQLKEQNNQIAELQEARGDDDYDD